MYFAQINSNNILTGIDKTVMSVDEYGSRDVLNIEVSEEVYNNARQYGNDYYIYSNGEIIPDPDYEQKQAQKREAEFRKEFFETSLGWIRRSVNMADGSKKDFLSDLLPAISMALNMGQTVNIITYILPDFSHDITDWTIYQEIKQVTPQFISECFNQLNNDFLG